LEKRRRDRTAPGLGTIFVRYLNSHSKPFVQIIHPWRDLKRYVEIRLQEALAEAELALRFMEEGLHRNAAGKAFQAWKAALAAAAALARDELFKRYRGSSRLGRAPRWSWPTG